MLDFGNVAFKSVSEILRISGEIVKFTYHKIKMYFVYSKARKS